MIIRMLFNFSGRINRRAFWVSMGALFIVQTFLPLLIVFLDRVTGYMIVNVLYWFFLFAICAICAKRLHDRNRSNWWIIVVSMPWIIGSPIFILPIIFRWGNAGLYVYYTISALVGVWLIIDLGCLRGTIGPNRYGPDPLDNKSAEVQL
jgi:uncharacterized membrane protein YhaH (DUF805 family)